MTYAEAKAIAQGAADDTGFDYYVEKDAFGYHFGMLPQRKHRFGHELRAEVVSCTDYNKIQPGHGGKP